MRPFLMLAAFFLSLPSLAETVAGFPVTITKVAVFCEYGSLTEIEHRLNARLQKIPAIQEISPPTYQDRVVCVSVRYLVKN